MKKLLLLLLLAGTIHAEGPLFRFKDTDTDQEFQNIYQSVRNPNIDSGIAKRITISSATISSLSVSTITASSATFITVTISTATMSFAAISTTTISSATITNARVTNLRGTTSSSDACTGCVGEIISGTRTRGNELSLTSGVGTNIASIALTPGHWKLVGIVGYDFDTTTNYTILAVSISTTSATLTLANSTMSTPDAIGQMRMQWQSSGEIVGNATRVFAPLISDVAIAASGTYYIVTQSNFSVSTLFVFGSLIAIRVM